MRQEIIDKRNQYEVDGKTCKLHIVKSDGTKRTYRFDTKHLARVKQYCWHAKNCDGGIYAANWNNTTKHCLFLHRLVTDCPPHLSCYFLDHTDTNCCISNLRLGTPKDVSNNQRRISATGQRHIYHRKDRFRVQIGNHWIAETKTIDEALTALKQYQKSQIRGNER